MNDKWKSVLHFYTSWKSIQFHWPSKTGISICYWFFFIPQKNSQKIISKFEIEFLSKDSTIFQLIVSITFVRQSIWNEYFVTPPSPQKNCQFFVVAKYKLIQTSVSQRNKITIRFSVLTSSVKLLSEKNLNIVFLDCEIRNLFEYMWIKNWALTSKTQQYTNIRTQASLKKIAQCHSAFFDKRP